MLSRYVDRPLPERGGPDPPINLKEELHCDCFAVDFVD